MTLALDEARHGSAVDRCSWGEPDQPVGSGPTDPLPVSSTTVRRLLEEVARLHASAADAGAETDCAVGGSILHEVGNHVRPATSLRISAALGDVLYECRGALDYAEEDSAVHRLASRIVEALVVMDPGGPTDAP